MNEAHIKSYETVFNVMSCKYLHRFQLLLFKAFSGASVSAGTPHIFSPNTIFHPLISSSLQPPGPPPLLLALAQASDGLPREDEQPAPLLLQERERERARCQARTARAQTGVIKCLRVKGERTKRVWIPGRACCYLQMFLCIVCLFN